MIDVKNVSKTFNKGKQKNEVLKDVSISIDAGEIVGFVGKSGEGKSTLARIMVGEFMQDSGNVYIDDIPLFTTSEAKTNKNKIDVFAKRELKNNSLLLKNKIKNIFCNKRVYNRKLGVKIQVIPQQPYCSLDPQQTVGGAVIEAIMANKKISKKQAKDEALKLFEMVNLDKELFLRQPDKLSGGQAQRIAIARAIAVNPKLLISDEATSMLDVISQMQVIEIFKKLASKGMAVLMISHDTQLIKHVCDRAYKIEKGKVSKIQLEELN